MLWQQSVFDSCFLVKCILRNHGLFRARQMVNLPPFQFPFSTQPEWLRRGFLMKKVLLLNGGKKFAHSDGRYNATLHEAALSVLDRGGLDVKTTFIDEGYDVAEEVAKFLWADVIIYQMPGWWMGAPWTVKKVPRRSLHRRPRQPLRQRWPHPLRRLAEVRQRRSDSGQAIHAVADLERTATSI